MEPERACQRTLAPLAIDFRHQFREALFRGGGLRVENGPEFRFQCDTGPMASDRDGTFLQQGHSVFWMALLPFIIRQVWFMRTPFIAAAILVASALGQASAQPKPQAMDPAVLSATGDFDDLNCAARYTLAAFVIKGMDSTAAAYYTERASAAGKRYMDLHPGESEASFATRVTTDAQALQDKLANNSLTPEALVADIKHCDATADSLNVL